jgi:hypothetical protein
MKKLTRNISYVVTLTVPIGQLQRNVLPATATLGEKRNLGRKCSQKKARKDVQIEFSNINV